ncbi:MAG: class II glutamine amidotransferase [Deltaproteobacteria bacterium]|nr:class II glutamine amidotransferase [Deltaproteobacteria bacterium]
MSLLLALSFDGPATPQITLGATLRQADPVGEPFGWGFAWYPSDTRSASVVKDPTSIGDNPMTKVLRDWERFRSDVFLCHVRGAAKRIKEQDTQPFSRAYAGRDWVLCHNGDLLGDLDAELPLGSRPAFEPVGHTDSEHLFCWLLEHAREAGARSLREIGWPELHGWLERLDQLGTSNLLLSDGEHLVVYHDAERFNGLHWLRVRHGAGQSRFVSEAIDVQLDRARAPARDALLFSSVPLSDEPWHAMQGGQMLVVRAGAIVWDSAAANADEAARTASGLRSASLSLPAEPASPPEWASIAALAPDASSMHFVEAPREARTLRVAHETVYRYQRPVERSVHFLRLEPVHDLRQHVVDSHVEISVPGLRHDYEDVFGNRTTRLDVESDFDVLRIVGRSVVRVQDVSANLQTAFGRYGVPPVWMPWQRQILAPYLLPPELPESQLRDLYDYALTFANRQGRDLLQTVLDMNRSIYREYRYVSGATTLATTPFDVLQSRKGVCQDFANLMICLARLLSVPARYRVGYIFTGADYENKVQSDASHAWCELYLPNLGWYGFDPTNGVLAGKDHVRVACGRNYSDATPTAGTIYKGGSGESLRVEVRVETVTASTDGARHAG